MKTPILLLSAVAATALAVLFGIQTLDQTAAANGDTQDRILYVWAGHQSRTSADSLTVIDFDDRSPHYGKVISTVPLPEPGASNNEPHHVGLSRDGRTLAAGGLLSVLKGQAEVFFFDLANPRQPKFINSADPPKSSITDEFYSLPNGGFLVTMMGGANGAHPGRVVEFSPNGRVLAEHPQEPPTDGFNPHGISVRPELNLMVTSDFICPSSTLHAVPGELMLRGSIRVWDFRARKIVRTVRLPNPAGTIDVQLIPRDRQGRAYTAGMTDDQLYLIDTSNGTAKAVFNFATVAPGGWPQLMRLSKDGTRMFINLNQAGKIAMLDISQPDQPKLLATVDLGPASGPHYLTLSHDEKRLVVSDYFLNEDAAGKVHAEGDHKVHVLRVNDRDLTIDPRFQVDFDEILPAGPMRPHGMAIR